MKRTIFLVFLLMSALLVVTIGNQAIAKDKVTQEELLAVIDLLDKRIAQLEGILECLSYDQSAQNLVLEDCTVQVVKEGSTVGTIGATPSGLSISSAGDLNILATKNAYITIGGDQMSTIGGDQTSTIGQDQTTAITGDQMSTIGGDQTSTIGQDQITAITGDQMSTTGGNATSEVGKIYTLTTGEDLNLDTGKFLYLSTGIRAFFDIGDDWSVQTGGGISMKADGDVVIKGVKIQQN